MKNWLIAQRYVRPLLQIASDKGVAGKVGEELNALHSVLTENPQLRAFLLDPSVSRADKKQLLDKSLSSAEQITRDFLKVLVDKGRTAIILSAYPLYSEMLQKEEGVSSAIVETALEVDSATKQRIQAKIEQQFGTKLLIEYRITPAILGGLRIQIGNVLLDRSVSGSLNRLKKTIAGE